MSSIKWITSGGGPYVLATKHSALSWLGTKGASAADREPPASDYERACQINDYVGVVAGDPNLVLVITEPDEIAWFSIAPDEGLLVKWIGADSDEQVLETLRGLDFGAFKEFPLRFAIVEPALFVFDSARKLVDIADNHLEFSLEPGMYAISLLEFKPNERVWLQLIRLKREPKQGEGDAKRVGPEN